MLRNKTTQNVFTLFILNLCLIILADRIIVRVFTLDLGQFVFKLFFAYPGISLIMGIIGLLISKKLWIAPLISFLSFSIVFYFFTTKMQFRIELIAYSLGFALIAFIGSALTAGIRKIIKSRSKE